MTRAASLQRTPRVTALQKALVIASQMRAQAAVQIGAVILKVKQVGRATQVDKSRAMLLQQAQTRIETRVRKATAAEARTGRMLKKAMFKLLVETRQFTFMVLSLK